MRSSATQSPAFAVRCSMPSGVDRVDDAVAEALAYAHEHRRRLAEMDNPVGYPFRVGQSRTRQPKPLRLFRNDEPVHIPDVEPQLIGALQELPDTQRISVPTRWSR